MGKDENSSEEYDRFEDLTRRLLKVPKKDVEEPEAEKPDPDQSSDDGGAAAGS